jgi:putative AlgH/UPF0301 family transcriptional regulator
MANGRQKHQLMAVLGRNKWKTREGEVVLWSSMDVTHLKNAVRMLKRQSEQKDEEALACLGYTGGEYAQMEAEIASTNASNEAARLKRMAHEMALYAVLREEYYYVMEGPING